MGDNIKMDLQEEGLGLDRSGSGQGQMAGTCKRGNEPSGSVSCGEFLDWKTHQVLKKDYAAWSQLPYANKDGEKSTAV